MTERLPFHFSLSCIGEGNGNPLQCPCLENPKDGGAWWAAIYGVAQSQTQLRQLSSSSSSSREAHQGNSSLPKTDFSGISTLFSIVAVLVCIPTNSASRFPFLHTFSSIYCLQTFGLQIELPYDPAIPLLCIHTEETRTLSNTIHKNKLKMD